MLCFLDGLSDRDAPECRGNQSGISLTTLEIMANDEKVQDMSYFVIDSLIELR